MFDYDIEVSRIAIIDKDINKSVNINIPELRGLLFRTSTIKFKVAAPLLSCEIRIGRIIAIRVVKSARVL